MSRADKVLCTIIGARRITTFWVHRRGQSPEADEPFVEESITAGPSARQQMLATLASSATSLRSMHADLELGQTTVEWHVLVSERWAPVIGVPWHADLAHPTSILAQAYAAMQFRSAGFTVSAEDVFRFAGEGYLKRDVVAMYGGDLMAALRAAALHMRAELTSLDALNARIWLAAKHKLGRRLSALALVDDGHVSLMYADPGTLGWTAGQSMLTASEAHAASALSAMWTRQLVRKPGLDMASLQVWDMALAEPVPFEQWQSKATEADPAANKLPSTQLAALQALRRGQPSPLSGISHPVSLSRWRMALAALTMVTASLAIWQVSGAWQVYQESLSLRAASNVSNHQAQLKTPEWTESEQQRWRSIKGAIKLLNVSPVAVLTAIKPPKQANVALLSVDAMPIEGDAQEGMALSIMAEAVSAKGMTTYVAHLNANPAVKEASLASHEVQELESGKPIRFMVKMSWLN